VYGVETVLKHLATTPKKLSQTVSLWELATPVVLAGSEPWGSWWN